jgi:DNA replication protein DnaC
LSARKGFLVPTPSTCQVCKGAHYLLDRQGERLIAKVCHCNETCERCGGDGWIRVEKDGYSYMQPCSCRAIAQRVSLFNQARMPARCGHSFDDFHPLNQAQQDALDAARTTAMLYRSDAPSKGFLVSGSVGTGKTHLLCATLSYLTLEAGVTARYVEISFVFSEIRRGFSDGRSGLETIAPLVETDVLAIDELGKGRGSAFELDTLDELIARRYNANRTTLFATNYSLAPERPRSRGYHDPVEQASGPVLLRERVGERIYSRLFEMCHMIELPAETQDFRRKDREAR